MSATIIPNGKSQWVDLNGAPLVGGKVYFYEPDSDVPKDTYQDREQSALNTNPVVLDDYGQAAIWGTGAYRQRVLDADNVEIYDVQTLGVADDTVLLIDTFADIATTSVPADVTIIQTGCYSQVGLGGARYAVTEATGYTSYRTRSDDGRWFVLAEPLKTFEMFGAIGDGAADDTAALTSAGESGFDASGTAGATYLFDVGEIILETDSQRFQGGGATFRPTGSGNAITIRNADNVVCGDFVFDGQDVTTGYLFSVESANRTYIRGVIATDAYNIAYVEGANVTVFQDVWSNHSRGPYMFRWYGTPALRSDVLSLFNVTCSADPDVAGPSRGVGVSWEGNCHTLTLGSVKFIQPVRGLHFKNAGGGSYPGETPAFLRFYDFQVDYPYVDSIYGEIGIDFRGSGGYFNNSETGAGIVLDSGVVDAGFANAYIRGNAQEGIRCGAKDVTFDAIEISLNSFNDLGAYAGARCTSTAERVSFANCHSGNEEGSGGTHSYGLLGDAGATNIGWVGGYLGGNILGPWCDDTGGGNDNFEVTANGSNLSVIDNVLLGTLAGVGAKAVATIVGGAITSVSVTAGGNHYELAPTVTAYDPTGSGSGATLSASVANGIITGISVGAGGSGYAATTLVQITPQSVAPTLWPYGPASSNISIRTRAKGTTGAVELGNDGGAGLYVSSPASAVSAIEARGAVAGDMPRLFSAGAATDIDFYWLPKGAGYYRMNVSSLGNYVNDAAAAAGGVPLGGLYRNGSVMMIRVA